MSLIELKGMTWDHERGLDCLVQSNDLLIQKCGISIKWDARSLLAFGDQHISEFYSDYDLMVIDHPHVPDAVHADAVIGDREGLRFAIDSDRDHALRTLAAIASHGRHAALADRIHPITHQLPEEDFVAAVDGLLDDGEDVFGVNLNPALFQHRHGNKCHWRRG